MTPFVHHMSAHARDWKQIVIEIALQRFTVATLVGIVVAACGLAVTLSWLLRAPWLASTFAGSIAMVFNTTLAFTLAGVALALPVVRSRSAPGLHGALCAATAIVAGLVLFENWLPLGLGVDWPTLHAWVHDQNPHPGRMAPNTALAFLLVALTLALRQRRVGGEMGWAEYPLSAAVITLGTLGVASNIFPLDLAYEWYRVPRMAEPTGAGFLILGCALWFDRMRNGNSRNPFWPSRENRIYAFLGAAVMLLLAIAAVSYGSLNALLGRAQWVEHTYAVRVQFDELIAQYTAARLAARSYLVDGAQAALPAFQAAQEKLPRDLQATRELVRDNPHQEARLATLAPMLGQGLSDFAAAMQAAQEGRLSRPQDILESLRASRLNGPAIDRIARDFRDEEIHLLASRDRDSRSGFSTAVRVIVLGNVTGLLILLYAFALLKRQNDQRTRLEVALQRSNHELEDKVGARAATTRSTPTESLPT